RHFLASIACDLAKVERVCIIVDGAEKEADVRRLLEASRVNLASVDFFHAPTDRSWTRDFVPLFVRKDTGGIAAVKFRFDGWARYDNHVHDEAAGKRVAAWR